MIYIQNFCLLLLLIKNTSPQNTSLALEDDISFRITNGRPADKNKFYPIVSIQVYSGIYTAGRGHFCAGSVVTKYKILTAAHCFTKKHKLKDLHIIVGVTDIFKNPNKDSIYDVSDIYIHPDFDLTTRSNDIAVIFLKREITEFLFTNTKIELTKAKALISTECFIIGWGTHSEHANKVAVDLSIGFAHIVDTGLCQRQDDVIICAFGKSDACKGDSGGPLICNNLLTGIVSYGWSCGIYPGAYTNIYKYVNWIEHPTRKDVYKHENYQTMSLTSVQAHKTDSDENDKKNNYLKYGLIYGGVIVFSVLTIFFIYKSL